MGPQVERIHRRVINPRARLYRRADPIQKGAVMQARPNLTAAEWWSPLAISLLAVFLVLPIILIGVVSFGRRQSSSIIPAFSWENYDFLFWITRHIQRVLNTFKYAIIHVALTI